MTGLVYTGDAFDIVGERKRSPSGRALPGEVLEFDRLAKEREAEIGRRDDGLRKRRWSLVPAKEPQP